MEENKKPLAEGEEKEETVSKNLDVYKRQAVRL